MVARVSSRSWHMRFATAVLASVIGCGWVAGASAQLAATTVDGYAACLSEELLDDLLAYFAAKDLDSAQAYLDDRKCIVLKGGLRVTITDAGLTKHEFAYMGVKLYTLREGLKLVR